MTEPTLTSKGVDLSSIKPSPEGRLAGMQEVGRKPLLRFLHSPHPCGLAMQEQLPRGNQNKEENLFVSPHPNLIMPDRPVRHPAGECKSAPGGFVPGGEGAQAVYVYEKPVRLWHSLNALVIVALTVTGYLIASPLASVGGEASDHFVMGYVRFLHFAAGYLLAIGLLFRAYWAYAGNEHARQIFMPPLMSRDFWQGVVHEILWYAFLVKEPKKYTGHNPLAVLFMHFVFVWGMLFMIITGFALYGEGTGQGSWQHALFSAWLLPVFGDSQNLHSWHHLVMWLTVCFVLIHVYVAVREDKLSRQSMLSTIATGWRTFKDDKPVDDAH